MFLIVIYSLKSFVKVTVYNFLNITIRWQESKFTNLPEDIFVLALTVSEIYPF